MTEDQLKASFPTLYQIHQFMLSAKGLGYGQIEFVVTTHNYEAKTVDMKAVNPDQEDKAKSITKRVMVEDKNKR